MDKYEYKVKLDQIEKLVAKKDYVTAAKIADGIDWRKVKSVTTLTMVADIYEENERLEDCYEILSMVYDRSATSRSVVYRMTRIATKMHDFEEAISLYKEYVRLAPHDLSRYILKYQIYRERGSSVEDQIVILEEYKNHEYHEQWAYELACLYEEAGRIDDCVEECDELILWFSEGEYVAKAMELKKKHQELTAAQQEKYEHRFDYLQEEDLGTDGAEEDWDSEDPEETEEKAQEPAGETEKQDDTPKVSEINTNKFNTMNLQEELAKGLQQLFEEEDEQTEEVPVKEDTKEFIPVTEVSIPRAEEPEKAAEEPAAEAEKETAPEEEAVPEEETAPEKAPEATEDTLSETAELHTERLKYLVEEQEQTMEDLLCTEEDGQISLAIGEENILEKQITGQMTIEEILEAWEEKKRQAKLQLETADGKKSAVLFETGEITNLLEDFIPTTPKETIEEIPEPEAEETIEETLEAEAEDGELEDDLPQDIDFAEAIESALLQSEEENTEEPEEIPASKEIGQDTASMLDAIEKALAMEAAPVENSGKYMTEEQEKIFAYFTSVNGMKKQLTELLSEEANAPEREDSATGNLVITGHPGNGKTTLAIDIVKAFQKQRKQKSGKLAKVTGDGLNKKDPHAVLQKLGGGALIVERAGGIHTSVAAALSDAMEEATGGLFVILEDEAEEIRQLFERNPKLGEKFPRSIDIPIFSNDELVAFGRSYAEEQEYYFDEMAVLALYDSIGVRQTADHLVNVTEVKELVDAAMDHADKKSRGLFARLSKKRIDEDGNKLLLEEDFEF